MESSLDIFPASSPRRPPPQMHLETSELPEPLPLQKAMIPAKSASMPNLLRCIGASSGTTPQKSVGGGVSMSDVVAAAQGAKAVSDGDLSSKLGAKLRWRKARLQIKIDCTVRKPRLVAEAPAWWKVPDRVTIAADEFDRRYRTNVAQAERLYYAIEQDRRPHRGLKALAFEEAVLDVNATRFSVLEELKQPSAVPIRQRKGKFLTERHSGTLICTR